MIGDVISHFRVVEELGRGGMGVVYVADDLELHRRVALKFLPQHLSEDLDANLRFGQEARAASALNHPNVCTIHEIGRADDGRVFIAMALYEGETLRAKLKRDSLSVHEAIDVARQIAEGLAAAHSLEIIHRDIKPANIFLTKRGRAVILDFGLAKLTGDVDLTKTGSTLGTVSYMAPEQIRGEPVDGRVDIWSLGIVLYEMLAGNKPFEGEYEQSVMYQILNEMPPPVEELNPEVPHDLARLVDHALEKDVANRLTDADAFAEELRAQAQPSAGQLESVSIRRLLLRPGVVAVFLVVAALIAAGGVWLLNRQSKIRWARQVAMPEIERLVEASWSDYSDAYRLETEAQKYIPNDPRLRDFIEQSSLRMSIHTEPAGADVFVKPYASPDSDWQYLGATPVDSVRMPTGVFRWRLQKDGYEEVLAASPSWRIDVARPGLLSPDVLFRKLDPVGELPEGMVRVPGGMTPFGSLADFFIDTYEVTNQQFKEFVDAGGYQQQAYWKHEFEHDASVVSWDDAIKEMVDRTGRPGPSTWQAGDYPTGEEDYPVSGISWYEAAAFAEWAGKRLPTSYHWGMAKGDQTSLIQFHQLGGFAIFAPFSNFGREGTVPVGSLGGITVFGAHDMGGNVREWNLNRSAVGRVLQGGSWDDNPYAFRAPSQAPAFDRSPRNGFRCALYIRPEDIPDEVFGPVQLRQVHDFSADEPVDDRIFEIYREQFSYDPAPINSVVEEVKQGNPAWRHERVRFDAAYGSEQVIAHVFLPRRATPPYQTVVYFPGTATLLQSNSENLEDYYEFPSFLSFLVKNGRAVVFPVYQGTFERRLVNNVMQSMRGTNVNPRAYTDYLIQVVMDFKRTVDYLITREDIDKERIAFYGMSWGGLMGAIVPAVDDRLAASVLLSGGLTNMGRPEAQQINYIGRVTVPTLMLNGRYDADFPIETSLRPMLQLLGTRPEDKELKIFDSDHIVPKDDFIRETLDWYDRYLGPVQ